MERCPAPGTRWDSGPVSKMVVEVTKLNQFTSPSPSFELKQWFKFERHWLVPAVIFCPNFIIQAALATENTVVLFHLVILKSKLVQQHTAQLLQQLIYLIVWYQFCQYATLLTLQTGRSQCRTHPHYLSPGTFLFIIHLHLFSHQCQLEYLVHWNIIIEILGVHAQSVKFTLWRLSSASIMNTSRDRSF